jgi:hypothetical protein
MEKEHGRTEGDNGTKGLKENKYERNYSLLSFNGSSPLLFYLQRPTAI